MRKSKFTESQIVAILAEGDAGLPVAEVYRLSKARACRIVGLSRSVLYRPKVNWLERDKDVIDALNAIIARRTRWGFWKCYERMVDGLQRVPSTRVPGERATGNVQTQVVSIENLYFYFVALTGESTAATTAAKTTACKRQNNHNQPPCGLQAIYAPQPA